MILEMNFRRFKGLKREFIELNDRGETHLRDSFVKFLSKMAF